MAEQEKKQNFWLSIGGTLTGIAAFLTALTGFVTLVHPFGIGENKITIEPIRSKNIICFENNLESSNKFYLGKWLGTGADIINRGYSNPQKDGFKYKFDLEFKIAGDSVIMNGIYYATPKNKYTPNIPARNVKGLCIIEGEFLKVIYDTKPLGNDVSKGFGMMLFKFLPSNTEGYGFFSGRSARTGELVCGYINLKK